MRIPITDKDEIQDETVESAVANEGEMTEDGLAGEATTGDFEGETDYAAQIESELAQSKAALLQLAADFENFRRQAARRESEARDRAVRSVVEDLLPVLDNFERAVDASRNATDVNSLRMGVEFILQQLQNALKSHGVEPIEATGQPFDPQKHEAVEQVSNWDEVPGTVVAEAQRGYTYKGQVLRASSVKVAQ